MWEGPEQLYLIGLLLIIFAHLTHKKLDSKSDYRYFSFAIIKILGDRLAVGLRTLTPSTQVRILVPQPKK